MLATKCALRKDETREMRQSIFAAIFRPLVMRICRAGRRALGESFRYFIIIFCTRIVGWLTIAPET